ncbi:PfkB family carbohydrate kinase [Dactylosporangium sp. CA-139114]|uniref:1-phosphofructokinase family hexose kinase n=1 Tax=Dactylosporangium sp. CA-139114 TaxID=3239931 RepID=UPI003D99FC11
MILTVTLNAALDLTYAVDELRPYTTHRVRTVHERAGGKGLNVASVLHAQGEPVLATGLLGGATGTRIRELLAADGVPHAFAQISGETRRTVTIADGVDATGLWEPGPSVEMAEWLEFLQLYRTLLADTAVVALSGSLPRGLPADAYAVLIELAHSCNVRTVLDTSGEPLRLGLAAGPDVVKPNADELAALLHASANEHASPEERALTEGHAPTKRRAPAEGHAPTEGHAPAEGHASAGERIPADEHTSTDEQAPMGERGSASAHGPIREHAPAAERASTEHALAAERAPAGEHIPADPRTPADRSAVTVQSARADQSAPADQNAPASQSALEGQNAPASQSAPTHRSAASDRAVGAERQARAARAARLDRDALRGLGAGCVVVSRGADGLIAVRGEEAWLASPPVVEAGNPTGAGDACVAALARGLRDRSPWPELLSDAVALSAAAVAAPFAGAVDEGRYRELRTRVDVSALPPGEPLPARVRGADEHRPAPTARHDPNEHKQISVAAPGVDAHKRRPAGARGLDGHERTPAETCGTNGHEQTPAEARGTNGHEQTPAEARGTNGHEQTPAETCGTNGHEQTPAEACGLDGHERASAALSGLDEHERTPAGVRFGDEPAELNEESSDVDPDR